MANRRSFIRGVASVPLGAAVIGAAQGASTASKSRDYFKELGVRTFINAAGTYTALTASLMPPEVVAAIEYGSKQFVSLNELAGQGRRAHRELLGCEAAMVTSGAAGALTVRHRRLHHRQRPEGDPPVARSPG